MDKSKTVAIYDRVQSATRTTPQVSGSRLRTSEIAAESAGHFLSGVEGVFEKPILKIADKSG
jgi:hypothetical protein